MNIEEFRRKVVAYRESKILHTALIHQFFDYLEDQDTAKDVARKSACNVRATERILNALVTFGVIQKDDEAYFHTDLSRKYLVSTGENSRYQGLLHAIESWENWADLPEIVKTGSLPERKGVFDDYERYRTFILAMDEYQRSHAEQVVSTFELESGDRVLDCGGGPGTYARAFKSVYPDVDVTLFDLPDAIEIAQELEPEHLELRYIPGDFFHDDLKGPYDVVFLSNIIHSWSSEKNKLLFQHISNDLNEKGNLVVRDRFVNEDGLASNDTLIFSIHMLVNNLVGGCYSVQEVKEWMQSAGIYHTTYQPIDDHTEMIIGEKSDTVLS